MKITEETKIKDLIPEDYVIDVDSDKNGTIFQQGLYYVGISIKKKEEKNFDWCVSEYLRRDLAYIHESITSNWHRLLSDADYSSIHIPFEIRIGLLKFIYDNVKTVHKIPFVLALNEIRDVLDHKTEFKYNDSTILEVTKVCHREFLDSIFE